MSARLGVGYEENNSPLMKAIKKFNRSNKGREKFGFRNVPRGTNFNDAIEIPPVNYEFFSRKTNAIIIVIFVLIFLIGAGVLIYVFVIKRGKSRRTSGGEICSECGCFPCVCSSDTKVATGPNEILLGGANEVYRQTTNFTDTTDDYNLYCKQNGFLI